MPDRRELLTAVLGFVTGTHSVMPAAAAATSYEDAAAAVRAPLRTGSSGPSEKVREAIRYATLAANSHNTQPWLFSAGENRIVIAPDRARRCPAVDPDDHHLFASLGCATENLVLAAAATGLEAIPSISGDTITVALGSGAAVSSPLVDAIPFRQCTRTKYDGKPVAPEGLRLLEAAGREPGVSLILITDRGKISRIVEYVIEGNIAQMRDKAFMDELKSWIRFSDADAIATRDGLSARASGNPALPSWIARPMLRFVMTESGESRKYREHIESSAGVAVFVSDADDKAHWIAAGRACQRFHLQATAMGLTCAHINQPTEVMKLRGAFASFLGVPGKRPDIVLRFGKGPAMPRSLRRQTEQVIREMS